MQSVQLAVLCHGVERRLKRDFGQQFTFVGGIDTQALIEGTPEQARQLTLRTLEIMMPGGGFIASPSHDYLLPETPVENVIITCTRRSRNAGGTAVADSKWQIAESRSEIRRPHPTNGIRNTPATRRHTMKRYGQLIGIKPEAFEEYKRYHAAVWPGILEDDPRLQHPQLLDLPQR